MLLEKLKPLRLKNHDLSFLNVMLLLSQHILKKETMKPIKFDLKLNNGTITLATLDDLDMVLFRQTKLEHFFTNVAISINYKKIVNSLKLTKMLLINLKTILKTV